MRPLYIRLFQLQKRAAYCNGLEFHFTPKHASWLNMAEIEIGNMNQQCLDRRIPNKKMFVDELAALAIAAK